MPLPAFVLSLALGAQAFDSSSLAREIHHVGVPGAAVRGGTAFLEQETLQTLLGADTAYDAKRGTITVANARHRLFLKVGSPTMVVDGKQKVAVARPFLNDGFAMVPVRAVTQALGRTVEFEAASNSLLIPRPGASRLPCVPLPTDRPGVVIASVSRGKGDGSSVQIQLLANTPRGKVVVQLLDADGKPYLEGEARGGNQGFVEVISTMGKNGANGDVRPRAVAAFIRFPEGTTTKPVVAKI